MKNQWIFNFFIVVRELEKQYLTVCERNKWLESRVASLQREIELLRDQNSLALEQRTTAEREAARLKEEFKVNFCYCNCQKVKTTQLRRKKHRNFQNRMFRHHSFSCHHQRSTVIVRQ